MKSKHFKYPITILLCFVIFAQSIFAGPPPDIVGQSAILMDRATGSILYQKNSNTKMYPASTTKILTSVLCLENLDIDTHMAKTSGSVQNVPTDSSHIGLRIGDIFPIYDAINAVMLGSDNYVSYDLATLLDGSIEGFADRMNAKARQIGASNSHFVNPHGYHDPDHYTTAHDLALIMDYAFSNSTFASIIKSPDYILQRLNVETEPIEFSNTVKLLDPDSPYYRDYILGGKTGYTRAAGRSLVAVAEQDGMELIGVVLKSGNPEFFEDMNTLFDYGFENFKLKSEGNHSHIENISFSPWAKEIVDFSLENDLMDPSTQSYQANLSKKDFIQLLMRTIYLSEHKTLDGFSTEMAINNALALGLIANTSLLSGFNHPISRETGASLVTELLRTINYQPLPLYSPHHYKDQNLMASNNVASITYLQQRGIMGSNNSDHFYPQDPLTLEEGLSLISQVYKLYSNSTDSYINKYKKGLYD